MLVSSMNSFNDFGKISYMFVITPLLLFDHKKDLEIKISKLKASGKSRKIFFRFLEGECELSAFFLFVATLDIVGDRLLELAFLAEEGFNLLHERQLLLLLPLWQHRTGRLSVEFGVAVHFSKGLVAVLPLRLVYSLTMFDKLGVVLRLHLFRVKGVGHPDDCLVVGPEPVPQAEGVGLVGRLANGGHESKETVVDARDVGGFRPLRPALLVLLLLAEDVMAFLQRLDISSDGPQRYAKDLER